MLVSPVVYCVVFRYMPMYGVIMAFKDFNIVKGIWNSSWAGFKHFEYIFGLSKFRQVFANTVVISFMLLILRLGRMMEAGFEQIFILYHPAVYRVADILGTYVYRIGITEGRFSMATAVGLFRSVINLVLLVSANNIARAIKEQGIY